MKFVVLILLSVVAPLTCGCQGKPLGSSSDRERLLDLALTMARASAASDPKEAHRPATLFVQRYGAEATDDLVDLLARTHIHEAAYNFVGEAIIEIADPAGSYDLSGMWADDHSNAGLLCDAILCIGGSRMPARLIKLLPARSPDPNARWRDGVAVSVCGLLRTADPVIVRQELDAIRGRMDDTEPGVVQALQRSLEYASRLSNPGDRNAYLDFERRLWWYFALVPKNAATPMEYTSTARLLSDRWKQGDERFVLRIFQEPLSTREEGAIAINLVRSRHLVELREDLMRIISTTDPSTLIHDRAVAGLKSLDAPPSVSFGKLEWAAPPPVVVGKH